jgi:hypothetical protein
VSDLVQGREYRQHQNAIKNGTVRANLEIHCTFVVSPQLYSDCSLIASGNFYAIQIRVIGLYSAQVAPTDKSCTNLLQDSEKFRRPCMHIEMYMKRDRKDICYWYFWYIVI